MTSDGQQSSTSGTRQTSENVTCRVRPDRSSSRWSLPGRRHPLWPRRLRQMHQRGVRTQNSLPSGSVSTTHGKSPCPMSASTAPRDRSPATSAAWSSRGYGRRSRWTLVHTVMSGTRTNSRYAPTPADDRSRARSSVTSCRVQSIAAFQNRAIDRGSVQLTTTAAIGPVSA